MHPPSSPGSSPGGSNSVGSSSPAGSFSYRIDVVSPSAVGGDGPENQLLLWSNGAFAASASPLAPGRAASLFGRLVNGGGGGGDEWGTWVSATPPVEDLGAFWLVQSYCAPPAIGAA